MGIQLCHRVLKRNLCTQLLVKYKETGGYMKYSIRDSSGFNALVKHHAKMNGSTDEFPIVIGVAKNAIPIKYKEELHDLEYAKQKSEFEQSETFSGVNKVVDVINVVKKYNANEEAKKNIDIVSKKIEAQVLGADISFPQYGKMGFCGWTSGSVLHQRKSQFFEMFKNGSQLMELCDKFWVRIGDDCFFTNKSNPMINAMYAAYTLFIATFALLVVVIGHLAMLFGIVWAMAITYCIIFGW